MARTPTTDTSHHGGEEWRDLDVAPDVYDPHADDDILRDAERGIREHRMRDVTLRLVDRDGKPLAGVSIDVEQTRHAFAFGDNLWALEAMIRDGRGGSERCRAWKEVFADLFTAANNLCYWTERPRNDGSKTEEHQGRWRLGGFADTVDWTLASGMQAKGHPLFWSIPKAVPDWVKRYPHETRMKFAEVRVRNIVARFKGRVTMWDAVNEPMWEPAFKNLDHRRWPHIEPIKDVADYIEQVLTWCREEDPDADFLVNDYGMMRVDRESPLTGHDGSEVTAASQRKRYLRLFEELGARGSMPDALGLQSHSGWMPHRAQHAILDEVSAAGIPIHITEFWASDKELRQSGKYSDETIDQLVAAYVGNFLTVCFGHPDVGAFFFWGLMGSGVNWNKDAGSGRALKPVYERVRELIHDRWRTRETLTTDGEGAVTFRGFFGDYAARYPVGPGRRTGLAFRVTPQAPDAPKTLTAAVPPATH